MNGQSFQGAYKTLADAKKAAEAAAAEGTRTGNATVMDFAREKLSMAKTNFREMLERETVAIPEKGRISIADYECLKNLARDNGCELESLVERIELVSSSRIAELDLAYLGLKNISAISGLTALKALALGGNKIINISAIAALMALRSLELQDNQVADITALAGLITLTELSLARNRISGINALSRLTALTHLDIKQNFYINNDAAEKQRVRALRSMGCKVYDGIDP